MKLFDWLPFITKKTPEEEVLEKCGKKVWRRLRNKVFTEEDAEDIFNEACLAFYAYLKGKEIPEKACALLAQIARNKYVDFIRRLKPESPLPDNFDLMDETYSLEGTFTFYDFLDKAAGDDPQMKECFLKLFIEGLTVSEVSRAMNIKRSTLNDRYNKILKAMSEHIPELRGQK